MQMAQATIISKRDPTPTPPRSGPVLSERSQRRLQPRSLRPTPGVGPYMLIRRTARAPTGSIYVDAGSRPPSRSRPTRRPTGVRRGRRAADRQPSTPTSTSNATPWSAASTASNATAPSPPATTNSPSATKPPSTSSRSTNGSDGPYETRPSSLSSSWAVSSQWEEALGRPR